MSEWKIKVGETEKIISVNDVLEALRIGASCVLKELEFNDIICGTPKSQELYSDALQILNLLQTKFVGGVEAQVKAKGPALITPHGRKKGRIQ